MTMPDSVSGVAGKPRDVNYDLLRVVAMCLVIGVHVISALLPSGLLGPIRLIKY